MTSYLLLKVSDCGPGVPAEAEGRIFNAFYTTKPNGMGLGLSVARTIVEAHGGVISIEPAFPRGAVFTFTVPQSR